MSDCAKNHNHSRARMSVGRIVTFTHVSEPKSAYYYIYSKIPNYPNALPWLFLFFLTRETRRKDYGAYESDPRLLFAPRGIPSGRKASEKDNPTEVIGVKKRIQFVLLLLLLKNNWYYHEFYGHLLSSSCLCGWLIRGRPTSPSNTKEWQWNKMMCQKTSWKKRGMSQLRAWFKRRFVSLNEEAMWRRKEKWTWLQHRY